MDRKKIVHFALATLLAAGLPTGHAGAEEKASATPSPGQAPSEKPAIAKLCLNCHEAKPGALRGNFESVAYKTQTLQMKIDDITEIVKFDKATLKTLNIKAEPDQAEEPLRSLKKGKEILVEFTEKDGAKFATLISAKPPIKVAPEKLVNTEEVEKIVALGPEKGGYVLIDARPAPRFQEGAIPTAINIPFPAFDKMVDKLPKDKGARIVYYCAGFT